MNGLIPIALALAATLFAVAETTIILGTGAVTGITLSAPAALAGAAVVGGLIAGAGLVKLAASRRRGRREAISCLPFDNPEMYFTLAANGDFLDCGRRFVCELEATSEDNLAQEEIIIRNLFGRGSASINGTAGNYYAEAGKVGSTQGLAACATTFLRCPFDRKTIFLAFQESKTLQ